MNEQQDSFEGPSWSKVWVSGKRQDSPNVLGERGEIHLTPRAKGEIRLTPRAKGEICPKRRAKVGFA